MTRKLFVCAMVLTAVGVLALPAQAKGISYANFTGPGLPPGGLTIQGDREELWMTGLLEYKGFAPPTDERQALGPAYQAVYHMDYAPKVALHQIVYPYAPGGPRTFTPFRQHVGQDSESFPGGWYHSSPQLLTFLLAHGFPREAPAGTAATEKKVAVATVVQESGGSSFTWLWTVIGLAVVGSLVALNLRLRGRRRT